MRKTKLITISTVLLVLSGCAANNGIYYWGNYSETAYDFKKDPNEKTRAAHIKTLNDIINKAQQNKKKIPPGIYAELGLIEASSNKKKAAIDDFKKEEALFPESKTLMDAMIKKVNNNA